MANFMDKVNVPIAIEDNTKLDLGHQHICSNTWFGLNVDYIKEMVPGESIDVSMETLTRLNAMPVPTFGRAAIKRFCCFVPSRTIWREWNDFINDTVHIGSDGSNTGIWSDEVPTVTNKNLIDAFLNASVAWVSGTTGDANYVNTVYLLEDVSSWVPTRNTYDIKYWNGSAYTYYNYTKTGRRAIALLEQLGYKLYWSSSYSATYNALPLMAVAKAWCDWMFPNQYVSISGYNSLMALLNRDDGANYSLSVADITAILEYCTTTFYDQDPFTACWDAPNSPQADLHSDFKIVNIDTIANTRGALTNQTGTYTYSEKGYVSNNRGSVGTNDYVGGADAPFITPYVKGAASNGNYQGLVTPISEYLLHSLHALSDFLKRNQIAGGRSLDRYLLRYGKALPSEKLNRSLYLSRDSQPIQIGDVMSTSDTYDADKGGNVLGAYAGKGLSAGRSHYSHSTDEFGYFIIFSTIVPNVGYTQGVDPIVQRTRRSQFYLPEFDQLGSEPVRKETLWVPQYADNGVVNNTNSLQDGVFGFLPRYALGYKVPFDKLTANFRLCSINGTNPSEPVEFNAANSWHLMRMFDYDSFGRDVSRITHNPNFLRASEDNMQYDRIFYAGNDVRQPDNFTTIMNFEIADHFPGKSLYDTYEFENEGRMVKTDVGGVRVN